MKDRSARGLSLSDAEFGGNTSGWEMVDFKVLVRKDQVEEKTDGGIFVPQAIQDQEMWNVQTGVMVSCGNQAFRTNRLKDNGEPIFWSPCPKVGDRVMFKELTGQRFIGEDGDEYLVYTDKDIIGIKS